MRTEYLGCFKRFGEPPSGRTAGTPVRRTRVEGTSRSSEVIAPIIPA